MPDNFLVIRIHPDSPVDGATAAFTWRPASCVMPEDPVEPQEA
jgi:hypothetical protein